MWTHRWFCQLVIIRIGFLKLSGIILTYLVFKFVLLLSSLFTDRRTEAHRIQVAHLYQSCRSTVQGGKWQGGEKLQLRNGNLKPQNFHSHTPSPWEVAAEICQSQGVLEVSSLNPPRDRQNCSPNELCPWCFFCGYVTVHSTRDFVNLINSQLTFKQQFILD